MCGELDSASAIGNVCKLCFVSFWWNNNRNRENSRKMAWIMWRSQKIRFSVANQLDSMWSNWNHWNRRSLERWNRQQAIKVLNQMVFQQNCWRKEGQLENTGVVTEEWADDWTNSTFIPLPKNGNLKQCQNYTALVFHASKVLLRVILERIRAKTESELSVWASWI